MAFRPSNGQCEDLYDYLILAYEGHESEMESSESGSDNAWGCGVKSCKGVDWMAAFFGSWKFVALQQFFVQAACWPLPSDTLNTHAMGSVDASFYTSKPQVDRFGICWGIPNGG